MGFIFPWLYVSVCCIRSIFILILCYLCESYKIHFLMSHKEFLKQKKKKMKKCLLNHQKWNWSNLRMNQTFEFIFVLCFSCVQFLYFIVFFLFRLENSSCFLNDLYFCISFYFDVPRPNWKLLLQIRCCFKRVSSPLISFTQRTLPIICHLEGETGSLT